MVPPAGALAHYRGFLRGYFERFQSELLSAVDAELSRQDSTEAFLDHLRRLRLKWELKDLQAPTHEIAEEVARTNAREFKRIMGLKVRGLEPGITERINRFRNENVAKIKSLQGQQIDELRGMLDTGLEEGKHSNTLRKEIQERFVVTRSKADLLARDQVLKLNANITKDRQTRAGVQQYRWITSRDERTRGNPSGLYPEENGSGNHWHLHGKTFSWDDPPVVEARTGRTAHPGEDYQCRCVAVPVIAELSAEEEALFESATSDATVSEPTPEPAPVPIARSLRLVSDKPPSFETSVAPATYNRVARAVRGFVAEDTAEARSLRGYVATSAPVNQYLRERAAGAPIDLAAEAEVRKIRDAMQIVRSRGGSVTGTLLRGEAVDAARFAELSEASTLEYPNFISATVSKKEAIEFTGAGLHRVFIQIREANGVPLGGLGSQGGSREVLLEPGALRVLARRIVGRDIYLTVTR